MVERDLKYARKVYQGFMDLGEELMEHTFICNLYDVQSIQFEQGPGSHITLHILYWEKEQDTGEHQVINLQDRYPLFPSFMKVLNEQN